MLLTGSLNTGPDMPDKIDEWISVQIRDKNKALQLAEYALLRGWSFQVDTVASEQFEEKEWVFSFPKHLGEEPERYLVKLEAVPDEEV
jgi:hypothetical protein